MKRFMLTTMTLLLAVTTAMAADRRYTTNAMKRVFAFAASVDTTGSDSTESRAYVKYRLNINRRNWVLLSIPTMYAIANSGEREHTGEIYYRLTTKGGDFQLERLASHSTIPHSSNAMSAVMKYLTPRIYGETMFNKAILSPFHYRNRHLYHYRVIPFNDSEALVSFTPKRNNTNLVKGWARIDTGSGRVTETAFDGEYDLMRFHIALTTGHSGLQALLPDKCSVNTRFLFLGNDITSEYSSVFFMPTLPDETLAMQKGDTALLDKARPFPLDSHEELLFSRHSLDKKKKKTIIADTDTAAVKRGNALAKGDITTATDTLPTATRSDRRKRRLWKRIGENIVGRIRYDFGNDGQGSIRLTPILNPLYFSYSGKRGLIYKMKVKASYAFDSRRALEATVNAGYSFRQRQLYLDIPLTCHFDRRHNGRVKLEWQSGSRITNSEVADAIKRENGDSIRWDKMNLHYFRNHRLKLSASYDISRHWGVEAGLIGYRRSAIDKTHFVQAGKPHVYCAAAPLLEVTFRPTGYHGPVITLDYERSIKGLLGSNTDYERIEADAQYSHGLPCLSALQLRAGVGCYTHKGKESYFLDYTNFRENNVPGGWNDDWACSFELLNSAWYNASDFYVRANATYETPMLLLSWLPVAGRLIERERIYVNALVVRHLYPYVEYGYGLATRAFSLGAFLSQRKGKIDAVSVRVGFELFRRW